MRRTRDRNLPDPFRAWINPSAPLPNGVILLPRRIDVPLDALSLVYPGLVFLGMGVVIGSLIIKSGAWREPAAIAFLLLTSILCFGAPFWFARRLWQTIRARQEQTAGALRQGVLIGREGVLVRLSPNRCYPISMDQFVEAKEWSGGGEEGTDHLEIVTSNGSINLIPHHVIAGSAEINQAVRSARSPGKRGMSHS